MSVKDDMAAIDAYIKTTAIQTPAARAIRDEWAVWYDSVYWGTQENYDHARNLRNQFNLANTIDPFTRAAAQRVIETGTTTEEMAGGTTRTLASGMYFEAPAPWVSASTKVLAGTAALIALVGFVAIKALELEPKMIGALLGRK